MYKSLENAVRIEAAKANGAVNAAYDKMTKAIKDPNLVPVGLMEDISRTQAALNIWTRLNLIADRYSRAGGNPNLRLAVAVAGLRNELVEEYEVRSTNPWVNAEAAVTRKAKVEIYAVLREFIED